MLYNLLVNERGKVMENKTILNKKLCAEMILQDFVVAYIRGGIDSVTQQYNNLLKKLDEDKKPENIEHNLQRRKILEKCRDLFKDISLKRDLDEKINLYRNGILESTGTFPTNSELAKKLFQEYCDIILVDGKRRYNMASLATKDTVTKVVFEKFDPKNKEEKAFRSPFTLRNKIKKDDFIHIEYIGFLHYYTGNNDDYIYKYRIYRNVNNVKKIYEVFSNLDRNQLEGDKERCHVVFTELLSQNNLENSFANGYIGEVTTPKDSETPLKVGEEITIPGFYKYQATENYAIEFDGTIIEAIQKYNQQELNNNKDQDLEL